MGPGNLAHASAFAVAELGEQGLAARAASPQLDGPAWGCVFEVDFEPIVGERGLDPVGPRLDGGTPR